MNAIAQPDNVVKLPAQRKKSAKISSRFNVIEFTNKSGSTSYRVDGYKRDRTRVRENFSTIEAASCRQGELETEWLKGQAVTEIQATKLAPDQLRLCEASIIKLGDDWQKIVEAVTFWQENGKNRVKIESPRVDEAVDEYIKWLDKSEFRDATKRHWKTRMTVFKNSVGDDPVAEVTPDFIQKFLDGRKVGAIGKDTDRRAVSRFFSWCIEKKWATTNPAKKQTRSRKPDGNPPAVLTVKQCKALLRASAREGLAPYVAVCMFGGIRPFEAARLTWEQVNLKDRQIRLEANQTKTRRPRTITVCDTLAAWLEAHKNKPFYPANWRKKFDAVKKAAKIKEWPADVLRHTAASHYFRKTGSYGQTAEQFGNSEAIIKAHYQGRVSSEDTELFYRLRPKKGAKK